MTSTPVPSWRTDLPSMSTKDFDDLVMRASWGEARSEELEFLEDPLNLSRWRDSLVRRRDLARRHQGSRNRKWADELARYGLPPGADIDDYDQLTEDEYKELSAFKEVIDEKNRSGAKFMGRIDDALAMVELRIYETAPPVDSGDLLLILHKVQDMIVAALGETRV